MKDRTKIWNGKQITEPGIYSGIPLDVYHSQNILPGPSFSSSNLRRVLEENSGSPAHCFVEWSGNPDQVEPPEKKTWLIGRAIHHLILGQDQFSREFIFRPEELPDKHGIITSWHGNKIVCQQWLAQAAAGGARWDGTKLVWVPDASQPPLTVLAGDETQHIIGIARSLTRHPLIFNPQQKGQGLLNGHIERSFFWQDKRTGLWLKARPDAVPTDSGDYADLKTTTSVQWKDLTRAISDYAYHQQAALIAEGSRVCADILMTCFALVFVEKRPPYCVRIVVLRDEHIKLGMRQNRRALDIIASCIKRKHWPGPGDLDIQAIDLSQRYLDEAELNTSTFEREGEAA